MNYEQEKAKAYTEAVIYNQKTQFPVPPSASTSNKALDELTKCVEENISRLRGQTARLITYIDRIVGIQPEPSLTGSSEDAKISSNSKLSELFQLNSKMSDAIIKLQAVIERLDII